MIGHPENSWINTEFYDLDCHATTRPTAAKGEPPRRLVDAMCGRLAKWLRLLGYDAEYWRDGSDEALIGGPSRGPADHHPSTGRWPGGAVNAL